MKIPTTEISRSARCWCCCCCCNYNLSVIPMHTNSLENLMDLNEEFRDPKGMKRFIISLPVWLKCMWRQSIITLAHWLPNLAFKSIFSMVAIKWDFRFNTTMWMDLVFCQNLLFQNWQREISHVCWRNRFMGTCSYLYVSGLISHPQKEW